MVDFKLAFEEGLRAAVDADRAREEIDSVFSHLNEQLNEISDGKIRIERRQFEKPKFPFPYAGLESKKLEKRKYHAIAAINPMIPDEAVKELAEWSLDKKGYPCKIISLDKEQFCEDKEALEQVLSELLRDPAVGEKLHVLMNLSPKMESTEAAV